MWPYNPFFFPFVGPFPSAPVDFNSGYSAPFGDFDPVWTPFYPQNFERMNSNCLGVQGFGTDLAAEDFEEGGCEPVLPVSDTNPLLLTSSSPSMPRNTLQGRRELSVRALELKQQVIESRDKQNSAKALVRKQSLSESAARQVSPPKPGCLSDQQFDNLIEDIIGKATGIVEDNNEPHDTGCNILPSSSAASTSPVVPIPVKIPRGPRSSISKLGGTPASAAPPGGQVKPDLRAGKSYNKPFGRPLCLPSTPKTIVAHITSISDPPGAQSRAIHTTPEERRTPPDHFPTSGHEKRDPTADGERPVQRILTLKVGVDHQYVVGLPAIEHTKELAANGKNTNVEKQTIYENETVIDDENSLDENQLSTKLGQLLSKHHDLRGFLEFTGWHCPDTRATIVAKRHKQVKEAAKASALKALESEYQARRTALENDELEIMDFSTEAKTPTAIFPKSNTTTKFQAIKNEPSISHTDLKALSKKRSYSSYSRDLDAPSRQEQPSRDAPVRVDPGRAARMKKHNTPRESPERGERASTEPRLGHYRVLGVSRVKSNARDRARDPDSYRPKYYDRRDERSGDRFADRAGDRFGDSGGTARYAGDGRGRGGSRYSGARSRSVNTLNRGMASPFERSGDLMGEWRR